MRKFKIFQEKLFMKTTKSLGSACRHCRHYQLEGRRGGKCQQFDVHVKGEWSACPLYLAAFEATWKPTEEKITLAKPLELIPLIKAS